MTNYLTLIVDKNHQLLNEEKIDLSTLIKYSFLKEKMV